MAGHLYADEDKGPPQVTCSLGPDGAAELLRCILQEDIDYNAARLSCVQKLTQAAMHCPSDGWVAELGWALKSKRCEAVTKAAPRACDAAVSAHTKPMLTPRHLILPPSPSISLQVTHHLPHLPPACLIPRPTSPYLPTHLHLGPPHLYRTCLRRRRSTFWCPSALLQRKSSLHAS